MSQPVDLLVPADVTAASNRRRRIEVFGLANVDRHLGRTQLCKSLDGSEPARSQHADLRLQGVNL